MRISIKLLLFLVLFISLKGLSQTTVFSDNFNSATDVNYTRTNGPIGTSAVWSMTKNTSDFGAKLNGVLNLTNDSSTASNANGWVLAQTSTTNFEAPYSSTLSSNAGLVTWTFNMRQSRGNPSGFSDNYYAAAMILAGTSGTTNLSGTGYAVVLGGTSKVDPVRLVKYNNGLRNHTLIKASSTSGLADFGKEYISVKVTYEPSTNQWQLFVRKDGTTSFLDPLTGNLVSQGTAIDNTYTGSNLNIFGSYWNGATKANNTAFFDNFTVSVVTPIINSISPSSAIAGTGSFTLTVDGENFNASSKIRWGSTLKTTTFISSTKLTATISAADIASAGTVNVNVLNGAAASDTEVFTIDSPGVPSISVSTSSLPRLITTTGTSSSNLSYSVSGANLTNDIIITPPSNFEVSLNGTTFSNSLTLVRTGFTLAATTIYVRVKASALPGVYSAAAIVHTTINGVNKNVNIPATIYATKPTTQPTGISFTNTTSTSFTVNWSANGNGTKRIVSIKATSAVNASPVTGVSYMTDASFGSGSEIGTGNYVIYANTGNSATVTDLDPSTVYHVAVYEYNGAAGTENYNTTSPLVGNRTTLNAPVGLQIYTANAVNVIDFDTTVDGVTNNKYVGDGLSPIPSGGQLNSNAWAITGLTGDTSLTFGEESPEETAFDNGVSDGGEDDGGLYAFQVAPNNTAFGIQPTVDDFNPGTVTLKIQNTTGATISSFSIGYKVYVYNDQASSTSFNFSHSSSASGTYSPVNNLNFTSPTTADLSPGWKVHYRVVTITGISLSTNNYYYLKWTGTNTGAAPFDEIALDDITVIANPTTNFASFNGTADTFIVDGNTSLNGNTTIDSELKFTNTTGKLDIKSNTLTIGGMVTNTFIGGLKGSNSSNIIVTGTSNPTLSFDQTTIGTTNLLSNLSVNTTSNGTVTIANPVVINGTLTTAVNQTLNMGTNALTGTLTTIANAGTIATQNTTTLPIPTGKTWTGAGKINYNATTATQTIVPGTYNGLTISTTGGGVTTGNITVNGVLDLPKANPSAFAGSLAMGTNTLFMGGSATNTGIGEVTGIITRTTILPNVRYTYGHPNRSILFPNYGTLPTSLSLKTTIGTAPTWKTDGIKRVYDLIQTGAVDTRASIRTNFLDSELNSNAKNKMVFWAKTPTLLFEQGKSNFDATNNWVELTNANLATFFQSTFDKVYITLANSNAATRTWTGAISTSYTTADNWFPIGTPSFETDVIIPQNSPIPPFGPIVNNVILNADATVKSIIIESGAIVNSYMGSDPLLYSNFTLAGAGGAWINNGTFNSQNSTIKFTNALATIAGTTNFNNLNINSGAGVSLLANSIIRIAGTLTNNGTFVAGNTLNTVEYNGSGQTIISPNGDLSAYRNLIISGTGAIFPTTLNVTGNLTINNAVDFTGKSLSLIGSTLQTIAGSVTPVFNNVTVNNTFGTVNLGTDIEIAGTLTLTNGRINLGNKNLALGNNPIAGTFSTTNMIYNNGGTGELRKKYTGTGSYLFPVGAVELSQSQFEYSPVTVNVTAGSFSNAYVGVKVTDGIHPDNKSVSNNISRYWSVTQSGISSAVATINGTYLSNDITGAENTIAAGQLNGSFNVMANPWIKVGTLSSNTLTATGVSLNAGVTSIFTGIKAGTFSAPISGYGEFCLNASDVELTAIPNAGDAPYTYSWSAGLGSNQTVYPSTNTAGTVNYTVIVKDGNGMTATDTREVTILTPTVAGTVSGNQHACANSTPATITLSGYNGQILHWQKSNDSNFTTSDNISNVTNELSGAQFGNITSTTYYRAVVKNGTCDELYSSYVTIFVDATTWNGVSWSNGEPTSSVAAIITGNYTATGNVTACSLVVSNNAVVLIPSTYTVLLNGSATVEAGSTLEFENNANLLQTTNVANSGNVNVKRDSSLLKRLDYTLWSSPVTGSQTLKQFSPATLENRFYNYDTNFNLYVALNPLNTTFDVAKGFLIRLPNTHPTTPTIWTGEFIGVPNNGDINYTLSDDGATKRFNLVGNPYPSPISAVDFVNANSNITKTLYFWRKTNNALSPSYCSWTSLGGFVTNNETQVVDPNGIIRTGQGFFVEGNGNGTVLNFNNSMRRSDTANQFFRTTTEIEKNRIWLNLTNANGAFSQTLIGYFTGATNDVDQNIDGKFINDGAVAINTLINDVPYTIQGKGLPFDQNDTYPLNFKVTTAGSYQIAIDHMDGLFAGSQNVYLQDLATQVIHDLKANPYSFSSESGTFNDRFVIVYRDGTLGTSNPDAVNSNVIVYKSNGSIVVNASNEIIKNVKLFDIRGRVISTHENVNSTTVSMVAPDVNGVILVQIELENNKKVTKKIVN